MSAPVTSDSLITGLHKYLTAQPDVTATLGTFPFTTTPYLFTGSLWVAMEGTSSTAAVISRAGGWAGANLHNTLRFPRISLDIYADPQRDAGNVTDPGEAERRIDATYKIFDTHLHRPQSGIQMWGDVRTVAATRLGEPDVYPVPDGDGLLRLQVFYGISEG